jgi:hypothetical protein
MAALWWRCEINRGKKQIEFLSGELRLTIEPSYSRGFVCLEMVLTYNGMPCYPISSYPILSHPIPVPVSVPIPSSPHPQSHGEATTNRAGLESRHSNYVAHLLARWVAREIKGRLRLFALRFIDEVLAGAKFFREGFKVL